MELSLAYELYLKPDQVPTPEAMALVRAAGFRYVDLSIGPFWRFEGSPMLREGWEAWAEGVAETARTHGLTIRQGHCWIMNPCAPADAPETAYATQVNRHLLHVARRMGMRWLVYHPGTTMGAVSRAESLRDNVAWFRGLLAEADRLGVGVAVENVFDSVTDHVTRLFGVYPDELLELLDALDHPGMGVCWDTGHAHLGRIDQRRAIECIGNRLVATHLHDNRGRMDYDLHIPPFYGSIDWQGVMDGLTSVGYAGTLNFETERHTIRSEGMLAEFRHLYQLGEQLLQLAKRASPA